MTSLVACVGFSDPSELVSLVRTSGEPFHELSSTMKWQDSSGALLLLDRTATLPRPGFVTQVRTPYSELTAGSTGLAQITLTDMHGNPIDRFTVVPDARFTVGWQAQGRVALVALSIDTEFFTSAEDFFDSPRSTIGGFEGEPPPEVKQFGLAWPPTMEIESFMPSDKPDDPTATLSGTVQFAEVRKNTNSGHEFLVARIATVVGEIDLCTPVPLDGVPAPGSVVVGQVRLHAGFPAHGLPEDSAYMAPTEKVEPNFRDGAPEPEEFNTSDLEDEELPDGLVLGDDGIVRTEAEHREWKDQSGSDKAKEQSAQSDDAEEPDTDSPVGTSDEQRADNPTASAQPEPADDDAAPRPGETRREWRERTGRS